MLRSPVDGFVFVRLDDVRLRPDTDRTVVSGSVFVVVLPGVKVQSIAVSGVLAEGFEGIPVVDEPNVSDSEADHCSTSEQT